jgi:hypothetical protein
MPIQCPGSVFCYLVQTSPVYVFWRVLKCVIKVWSWFPCVICVHVTKVNVMATCVMADTGSWNSVLADKISLPNSCVVSVLSEVFLCLIGKIGELCFMSVLGVWVILWINEGDCSYRQEPWLKKGWISGVCCHLRIQSSVLSHYKIHRFCL